jgi:hypothetical protein
MTSLSRRACLALVAALLSSLLVACGGADTRPGGLEGQVLGMLSPTEQPVLLQGAVIAINGPGGSQTSTTDAQGKYRFDELRPGEYGLAASYQGSQAGSKSLQPEERLFSISPGQQETISLVLLAEGIAPPPTPPAAPVAGQPGGQPATGSVGGVGGGGLLTDPFFWYFLFNRPGAYGYGRPPVIVGGGGGGPVVIDSNQPQRSSSGRVYTEYGEPGSTGVRTKPLPQVTSKGTTRPGASGASSDGGTVRPPIPSAPAARPPSSSGGSSPAARPPSSSGSDGSKGTTRPGGGSSAPSVKPPSAKPPAVRPPSGGKRGR